MKVVVQNGADHALSRRQAEAVVRALPPELSAAAKSLILYQAGSTQFGISFQAGAKALGLYSPRHARTPEQQCQAIDELVLALSIVAERGDLPPSLGRSMRAQHLAATAEVRERCHAALAAGEA